MPQHRFTREEFEFPAAFRDERVVPRCRGVCNECTTLVLHVGRELWDHFRIEPALNGLYTLTHLPGSTINLFTLSPIWRSPGGRYYLTCDRCTIDPTSHIETPRGGEVGPNRMGAVPTEDLLIYCSEAVTLRWTSVDRDRGDFIDPRCLWCHVNLSQAVPVLREHREWLERNNADFDEVDEEEEEDRLSGLVTDRSTLQRYLEQERRRRC